MADHLTMPPLSIGPARCTRSPALCASMAHPFALWARSRAVLIPWNKHSVEVRPTTTRYQFAGAGIQLTLSFLTPALSTDLDILSRPATYLTWKVQSTDAHPTRSKSISTPAPKSASTPAINRWSGRAFASTGKTCCVLASPAKHVRKIRR